MPQRPLSKIKVIKAAFVKGKRINREEKKEENMAEQEKHLTKLRPGRSEIKYGSA